MNSVLFSSFPYLFWFMRQNKQNVSIDLSNMELKNAEGKIYQLKKFNKAYFLAIKFLPVILLFGLVFNKYDFVFTQAKFFQYTAGLILATLAFYGKKTLSYIVFFLFLVSGFFFLDNVVFAMNYFFLSVPFAMKYFFLFVIFYSFVFDLNKTVYSVKNNNITVSHIILERVNE